MPLRSLLMLIGFLSIIAVAEPVSCPENYAKVSRGNRMKAIGGKAYNFAFRNTVNDYRGLWKAGPPEEYSYRVLRRFFFAPRVREADPVKRAEALKKIQWMSALNEPVFDGMIELASKAKVVGGKWLGIETKPFESNISIPGGILISSITGYGTMAYLAEKAENYINPSAEAQLEKLEEKDKLGSKYLAAWEKLGILSNEQRLRANNNQVEALKAWGENLGTKSTHRPLPPRMYQLRLEGMLKSSVEVSELEEIALRSLQAAQKAAANNPKIKEDQETKRFIMQKLNESGSFKDRSILEKELLAMVLDPPVFLDGMVSNIWYREATEGEYGSYKERRKQSDTYWLTQLVKNQKDPTLAKIREEFLKDPKSWDAPFLATYAALNFSPQGKPSLPELREALLKKEQDVPQNSIKLDAN
ncbi:MAG: hypothetical protein ACXVBE_14995 [Bdellovibrionota bacterium]